MCGLAGACHFDGAPVSAELIAGMTAAVAHRGPDGCGQIVDGVVGLGHRRLAIIDLECGDQPMLIDDGKVVVIHNGEIYNFRELRKELEGLGHQFRSRSDTEVIGHAYQEWGEACVGRFNGMFACVIWDRRPPAGPGRIFIARDRYGVKPLYYHATAACVIFSSEIKALLRHPSCGARLSLPALNEYFTFQNVFSDLTLFEGVRLLPAGCTLTIDIGARTVDQKRYWDYQFASSDVTIDVNEARQELLRLFEQAVERQLVSDVPIGAYLSGGMDSGSITAVASRHLPRMRTFTGGFDLSSASGLELGFDERPIAEMVANRYKTEHYEMVMHAGDMEHVLPELIWHLEDLRVGQCYPNYYVARLASRFVKVVLSGSGGDELFAGYPWRYYRQFDGSGSQAFYDTYYDYWQRLIPDAERSAFWRPSTFSKVRDRDPRAIFKHVIAGARMPVTSTEDVINVSLYFEIKTFLHGLLVVEDKLSMAHGLETRVPFLDNDLVDFALSLPPRFKLRDLERAPVVDEDEPGKTTVYRNRPSADGKVILREAMQGLIPSEILSARKQGFSAPDASWFAGESIDYVNAVLRNPRAHINEYFEPAYVGRMLDEHTAGKINHRLLIWSLLSFEEWCKQFLDGGRGAAA
jgi:asparagine synthase (glutamine-hydrolysing)